MDTVMIVEDEKLIRQGIKSMVLRSEVPVNTIIECNNGQVAIEVLKKQKVDVMFTDIRMPKMDGIALAREIKKLGISVIIVAISGYDEFDYAVEMMRNNAREYLVKPIDRAKIKELMEKFEKEINDNQNNDNELREIYIQQLKYLLINENMSKDEMEVCKKRFESVFFKDEYVVIRLNLNGKEINNKNVVCLKDIDNSDVCIVEKDAKYNLLKEDLADKYVGISKPYKGLDNLKNAYLESLAMRKQAFTSCRKVVEAGVNECCLSTTKVKEDVILRAVQKMGTDKASQAIDTIEQFVNYVKGGKYSFESFERMITLFVETAKNTYKSVLQDNENINLKLENMNKYDNIDEFLHDLINWINETNSVIIEKFDDYKNKQKVQTAVNFIDENYNKDLNMAVVSNYINMNYSLFSYSFKQYTGMNFVNYLKEKRIKEAKRLLEETELHVNEISGEVGYDNEKHFMKIFKSMCGVSPSEYRKNASFKKDRKL